MKKETSWEKVTPWYDAAVGKEGHFYHQTIVLPGVLKLLNLQEGQEASLLDLACGQGVLAHHIPASVRYQGVDLSPSLIQAAKKHYAGKKQREFAVGDICAPLPVKERDFSHAAIILALQNVEFPQKAILEASSHLKEGGTIVIVLNHPCFRIPRQTHWGIDEQKKLQYRRVDRYLSPLKIPIQMNPGSKEKSSETWSFHFPLSYYFQCLKEGHFLVETMEEWVSEKKSTGQKAKMEDRARDEFPLFLAIKAKKVHKEKA